MLSDWSSAMHVQHIVLCPGISEKADGDLPERSVTSGSP